MYILRRDHWGENACKHISQYFKDHGKELKIINAHRDVIPDDDWCIRWATTSRVPGNPKVINKIASMNITVEKGSFRKKMADAGLAPKTYLSVEQFEADKPEMAQGWVVRKSNHKKGEDLWICTDMRQVKNAVRQCGGGYYISEFIDKDREFRVYIVSGRIVAMIEKHPDDKNDVAWGLGGDWSYINWNHWPLEVARVSCEAFKLSSLDFGAVDMITKGKTAYCLEINTGPGDIGPYYGGQLAKGFMYMIEKDDRSFIEPGKEKNYHSYIHPALEGVAN